MSQGHAVVTLVIMSCTRSPCPHLICCTFGLLARSTLGQSREMSTVDWGCSEDTEGNWSRCTTFRPLICWYTTSMTGGRAQAALNEAQSCAKWARATCRRPSPDLVAAKVKLPEPTGPNRTTLSRRSKSEIRNPLLQLGVAPACMCLQALRASQRPSGTSGGCPAG